MSTLYPLQVSGACATRGGQVLVGPLDVVIDAPKTTVVIGPNGSGKTTFLRLLNGAERCAKGSVTWGADIAVVQQQQSFVFQTPIMLRRSVVENLIYPLRLRGVARAEAIKQAKIWIGRLDLDAMADRPAPMLSGGEQQKLALARALITKPKILFLDEPCASLDGRTIKEIERILQNAKAAGTALILSTHDLGQARRLADEVIFILGGRIHEQAKSLAFFKGPKTAAAKAFLRGDIVE